MSMNKPQLIDAIAKKGTIRTKYAHLKEVPALVYRQEIKEGDDIGILGNTGRSTRAHLHYEIEKQDDKGNWNKINPVVDERKQVKSFTEDVNLVDPQLMINERDKPLTITPPATTKYEVKSTSQ